jgi:hypothetical protein
MKMNHMQILKRSWAILWSYKALWLFGIILALTTASYNGGGSNGGGSSSSHQNNGQSFTVPAPGTITGDLQRFDQMVQEYVTPQVERTIIGVVIGLVCLGLLLAVAFRIANYVSEVALIRMVDQNEATGEQVGWRKGIRLGWSRDAWRLFLIDLAIGVPIFLAVVILLGCAVVPLFIGGNIIANGPNPLGIVAAIGIGFLLLFTMMVVGLALSILMNFIRRVCVLEGLGVGASIRGGWKLVRSHFKDVILMWLIVLGIQIAYLVAIIIPAILLVGIGLVLGGGIGVVTYLLTHLATAALSAPWIVAGILGGTIFILVLAIPLTFVAGLKQTYLSTTWTLAYRDIQAVPQPVEDQPVIPDSGPEGALPA